MRLYSRAARLGALRKRLHDAHDVSSRWKIQRATLLVITGRVICSMDA